VRDQNELPYIIKRTKPKESSNGVVGKSSQREKTMPSSILEKGIIYFFIRNRVGVNDAESVSDLQRIYFVLRPLPKGAKLGDGAIEDL
jgi:uroporphyrinogen-III synthase